MKLKQQYVIREFNGTIYAVPDSPDADHKSEPIILNGTGRILFSKLLSETDEAALSAALTGEYEIDKQTADADVAAFIAELRGAGLLDTESERK